MTKTKIYQKIFAIVFMVMLFTFAGFNFFSVKDCVYDDITSLSEIEEFDIQETPKLAVSTIDNSVRTHFLGGYMWNEVYGTVFATLGKNEENNFSYVRDKDGSQYYANFWNVPDLTMKELAVRMRRMQDDLSPSGTKVILLLYPTKYDDAWADGYYGIPYQDYNQYADELLRYLRRYNVDYIDYREVFKDSGLDGTQIFYNSDHHWNPESAFMATKVLVEHIREEYNDDLDPDYKYLNPENYYFEDYKDIFMGSMGRESGEVYSGLDDCTLIIPKFDTLFDYTFYSRLGEYSQRRGPITDTLISRDPLISDDIYDRDMNSCYSGGIHVADEVVNKMPDNDISVMFLRNSFSSPVGSFMAPMVYRLDMIWTVNSYEETNVKKLRQGNYDYVIVAVNVDNLDNDSFLFYTEPLEDAAEDTEVTE